MPITSTLPPKMGFSLTKRKDVSSLPRRKNGVFLAIPEGVTVIHEAAFAYSSNLTEVVFPEGLTHIGEYAFEECIGLTQVTLPDTLRIVEE